MTHRELCIKGAKFLKNQGIFAFHKCRYVVCELERAGESPDAFGWVGGVTQLIEVKVTRSDFLSDKKKMWRMNPNQGLGKFRSYLCPEGIIKESDLPENWGLLYINDKGKIYSVKEPISQESDHYEEIDLITSILRREGFNPQIFSYKKYKADTVSTEC